MNAAVCYWKNDFLNMPLNAYQPSEAAFPPRLIFRMQIHVRDINAVNYGTLHFILVSVGTVCV